MSEWRDVTLAEISERVDYGYTASASDDPVLPRFLRITDIAQTHLDWSGVPGCSIDGKNLSKYELATDDIVVARTGATVGYAKRIRTHPLAVFASYLVRFRLLPDAAPSFVGAIVESNDYKQWVQQNAGGAAQPNASAKVLGAFPLRLPDKETQVRIGAIFDNIDDLIENNRRRIEVLEEMARAIYREWFVKFRYPGHEDVPMVDSVLGPIPEGWEVVPASTLITVNPRIKLDKSVKHPFITMGDLDEGSLSCRPSDVRAGGSGSKFELGDTLFARITPCLQNGKTGLVQSLAVGEVGMGSTEFIVLRGRLVGSAYTYCLARDEHFRGHAISSMSGASGRQRVRNECFDSYLIAAPPGGLSDEFEDTAESLLLQAKVLFDESGRLGALRDALLPKLVTGQIDISTLDLDALVARQVAQ